MMTRKYGLLTGLIILVIVISGCKTTAEKEMSEGPINRAQYQAYQQQLLLWEPLVNRINYMLALPVAGQPEEEYLTALHNIDQTQVAYFSSRASSNFNLSRSQVQELNKLYSYSMSIRKKYRVLLGSYQRMADGRQGFPVAFRDALEQVNQAGREFVSTWRALHEKKSWRDSPRDFNWYLDK